MNHKVALYTLLGLIFLVTTAARAENHVDPKVTISLSDCKQVVQEEVERILQMELRSIAAGRDEINARDTDVTASCEDSRIVLTVEERRSRERRVHEVPLDESSPTGMDRLVAIAAAELVFSSWVEFNDNPESTFTSNQPETDEQDVTDGAVQDAFASKKMPTLEDTNTSSASDEKSTAEQKDPREPSSSKEEETSKIDAPTKEDKPATKNQKRSLYIGIGGSWRMYVRSGLHLFGGEVWLRYTVVGPFYLRLAATAEGGSAPRTIGTVSLFGGSGLVAIGGLFTLAEKLDISIDAGFRSGYGFLKGVADNAAVEGETVHGGYGGPLASLALESSTKVSAGVHFEVGYAVWGNRGEVADDTPVEMKGLWISALIAVGFGF